MQQANDNFYILLLIATAGILLLTVLPILLVIVNRNKLLRQERAMQDAALEHQKTLVQAIVQSQENERRHIGSELHDNIINSVMLLNLLINKEEKKSALELSDKIANGIRSLSHGLSPASLRLFGLEEALCELTEQLQESSSLNIDLRMDKENVAALGYETTLHIYRIIQELVTNTLKYAEAKSICIHLKADDSSMLLFYSDDGKGFEYSNPQLRNNGIYNIESRLQVLQATHRFFSEPGKGMQLNVTLPLHTQTVPAT